MHLYRSHALLWCLILLPQSLYADQEVSKGSSQKAMPYEFHISIGRFAILNSDSSLSVKDEQLNSGVAINLTDTLGFDFDHDITRLNMRYRFSDHHGISFSWFDNASTAAASNDEDIVWPISFDDSQTLYAGSLASIDLDYDITRVGYDWSFYHNDKIELYTLIGVNFMHINITYNIDLQLDSGQKLASHGSNAQAPLPAFGLGLNFRVNERFYWHIKNEVFAIKIDDISGTYSSLAFGAEYALFDHIGLGATLHSEKIDLREKTPDVILSYNNNFSAFNIYLAAFF